MTSTTNPNTNTTPTTTGTSNATDTTTHTSITATASNRTVSTSGSGSGTAMVLNSPPLRVPYGSLDDSVIPPAQMSTRTHHRRHQHDHHQHHGDYCDYHDPNDPHGNPPTGSAPLSPPPPPPQAYRDDSSYTCYHPNNDQNHHHNDDTETGHDMDDGRRHCEMTFRCCGRRRQVRFPIPTIREWALTLSLYGNMAITLSKLVAYCQTFSLSVLAALLDSVLDVVSQIVLNYTERRSSGHYRHHNTNRSAASHPSTDAVVPDDDDDDDDHHNHHHPRSSAYYPAGASRFEPIGVLTCAALMGMASFEVLKQSSISLLYPSTRDNLTPQLSSVTNMVVILCIKLALLLLCRRGANKRYVQVHDGDDSNDHEEHDTADNAANMIQKHENKNEHNNNEQQPLLQQHASHDEHGDHLPPLATSVTTIATATTSTTSLLTPTTTTNLNSRSKQVVQFADPTVEALAQDHYNDCLSNGVAAIALLCTYYSDNQLWFVDPLGAIVISLYIIYSWYMTGKEQIEHLTGRSAPAEFIQELIDTANDFDERIAVDTVRAYHFGPKFLVEIEIVMNATTLLFESHDLGMDLQYEIEGREEVERCFVHIDYQTRPYDEHVVSKVPELREKFNITKQPSVKQMRSTQSI